MALTLGIADNQNGTATATLAGTGGAATSVYTSALSQGQPGSWTLAGSRTGDGTLTLGGAGLFWAYATTGAAPSVPVAYGCTSNALSTHWRCLQAVQGVIQSLALSGIAPTPNLPPARVYIKSDIEDPNVTLPAVLVAFEDDTEQVEPIGFGGNEYGWPVSVYIADRHSPIDTTRLPSYLNWRKALLDNLQALELANCPEVFNLTVEPGRIARHVEGKHSYFLSVLRVRCHAAETIAL